MKRHYVKFLSPGTFFSEVTNIQLPKDMTPKSKEAIDWACEKARGIKERHGATPYGFRFETHKSNGWEAILDEASGIYYLGGELRAASDVLAGTDPSEEILRTNVRINGIKFVITNNNSYKVVNAFEDGDVLLDWKP